MHLKKKSEINATAADKLIKMELYAPAIHCSYYSCYQHSMWKLNNNGIDYATQKSNSKESHIDTIKATEESLIPNGYDYSRNMLQLKRLRKKSDYENQEIMKMHADTAYGYMQDVLSILTEE